MTIQPFLRCDIPAFISLAAQEGWIAERWEFDFLLATFPKGCFCVRDLEGKGIAFVTSLRHERSAWIGNLIVAAERRGQRIGEGLFVRALEALRSSGAETFWLTASKLGKTLYEKHGFSSIDTIMRWTGAGRQRFTPHPQDVGGSDARTLHNSFDCLAWGDSRSVLLKAVEERGEEISGATGFMVVQPCGDARQLGPFSAMDSDMAEQLLDKALGSVPSGTPIYCDVPASNRAALRLFNRRRMRITGSNELMYAGRKPDYRPEYLYGLATMGSCG